MTVWKCVMCTATLALLAIVCRAAIGASSDDGGATSHAVSVDASGEDTASIPDFDGDGTIGFGDFLIFAGVFGASKGDEKYDATYDLNEDGEIGFSDFVIFAQNFGKEAPSPVVVIPDDNLRAAIEAALGKDSGAPITAAEMSTLDSLDARESEITELTGLQFAVNLAYLNLNENNVSDITALEGLTNLTHLALSSNDIADLASLVANTGLGTGDKVDLRDNPLNVKSQDTHIPALRARGVTVSFVPSPAVSIPDANLRAAIEAALDKVSGAPITVAEMATLDSLDARESEITELTGLQFAVNLAYLNLNENNVSDITALEGLTNLTHLALSSNDIADLASLVANTGLGTGDKVDLTDNPLNVSSQDTHIPALRARGVGISFVPPAVAVPDANLRAVFEAALDKSSGVPITQAEMATLDSLDANDADISDLTGLESAVNLTYLSLNDNKISNISTLAKLTRLERLWLSNNRIEDISALAKLTNLTELWLWNNRIEDISALSGLTGLTRLSLGSNNVKDISALSNLTNLRMLILKSNRVSDLAPLAANKGLDRGATVDVTDNPLNATSESTHIPALQARGVTVSFVPSPAVVIPDANLRAAIAAALGKAAGAPITVADMKSLDFLNAGARGISDLKGLEAAANLTELSLVENNITNISPLSGLTNLRNLIIWGNRITDASPLSGLTNLERLSLEQNHITNISPLARLTNLTSLSVGEGPISDLSALSGLSKLTRLKVFGTGTSDLSPLAGLINLRSLALSHGRIADISDLAKLTGLTRLWLWDNQIEDISAISDMTDMTFLSLGKNNVSDISVLSGLTSLTELYLNDNKITDVSPLAGLTNLTFLDLALNNVVDISPLGGLTSLVTLNLAGNRITDIAALSSLTNLRDLDLRGNPYQSLAKGDFDIELIFLDSFSESQKNVLQYVARRWMAVVRDDIPDFQFAEGWSGRCGGRSFNIPPGERIDDLRIYVSKWEGGSALGYGSPILLREASHLPVLGCMAFELSHANLLITGLHEIGHVLGFASEVWNEFGFFQNPPDGDTHFSGPLATAAFDQAGGRAYRSSKVPLQKGESHWRGTVFGDELMTPTGTGALSAITVQSMADIGYGVDVTQADPYSLPGASAGAKIAAATPSVPGSGAIGYRPGIIMQSGADRYGQRSIEGRLPLDPADGRTGRLESAERIWGGGVTFGLPDDRQIWGMGSASLAEPELTCGAGLMREPIYVVDKQGRVVRTINR